MRRASAEICLRRLDYLARGRNLTAREKYERRVLSQRLWPWMQFVTKGRLS